MHPRPSPRLGCSLVHMANGFNSVSKKVIFQEFYVACGDIIQFIPFAHALYVFEFPLFYSHYIHESDVIIIPSTMGTHQGDILGKNIIQFNPF